MQKKLILVRFNKKEGTLAKVTLDSPWGNISISEDFSKLERRGWNGPIHQNIADRLQKLE